MAQLELGGFRTRGERDEDCDTSLIHDDDWWFETEQAFLAEVREGVPPRLLEDLANAPLVNENFIGGFKHLRMTKAK
jgi:hypothetical protein